MRLAVHADLASQREEETCRKLSRILPNARGPRQRTKGILSSVVTTRLLYGSPIWYGTMMVKAINCMASVLRHTMLRVASCYNTTSYEAAAVVLDIPPLRLIAEACKSIYGGTEPQLTRRALQDNWKFEWHSSRNKRWTHRLKGDARIWHTRKPGETSFHLTISFHYLVGHIFSGSSCLT